MLPIKMRKYLFRLSIIQLLFLFWASGSLYAQTYGLSFDSHDVLKDERTHIDLNHDKFFSFNKNFKLEFSMSIRPNLHMNYGYILRIIDDKGKNVDLIFNYQSPLSNSIIVVYGQDITNISLKPNLSALCCEWSEFALNFDLDNQILTFNSSDTTIAASGIKLNSKVKILFGASDYLHFKTTDVPPMNIKDIRISEMGKIVHNWPLDEIEGNIARDLVNKKNASVLNPNWLKPLYHDWKKTFEVTLNGCAEIAFSPVEEKFYFAGDNQMEVYSVGENNSETFQYKNNPRNLKPGCQAFYDTLRNLFVSYNIDQKSISTFNPQTREWEESMPNINLETVFLQHNKYFSAIDSTLYIFGGYGQHEYKNIIQQYAFSTNEWKTIDYLGNDVFYPRYLSALGETNDSIYILGGYGSTSGEQILKPQNYYDLLVYSLKDKQIIKKYDFHPPIEDVGFANSMVIDQDKGEYYALAFPIFKYDSYLQLVKGSLSKPELKMVGNKIPYQFSDVVSFADLYYCKTSKKLFAVTMLVNDQNQTQLSLYSIAFPPNDKNIPEIIKSRHWLKLFFSILLLAIIFGIVVFNWYATRKENSLKKYVEVSDSENLPTEIITRTDTLENNPKYKNTLLFFGGFQMFDKNGLDITNKFSPLLKELFLLIWLYSIKNNKGITSQKLTEILWFDKDTKSAKNNLAVNIIKLKLMLKEVLSVELSRRTGYWKISFEEDLVFNDYFTCLNLCNNKKYFEKPEIIKFVDLARKGDFLSNSNYEWLDKFKADISNSIIDKLVDFASHTEIEADPNLILHLADSILNFDIINEEAMILKCKAYLVNGKHRLANDTFSKFAKDYSNLYGVTYEKTFKDIAGEDEV